jgi:hypothetical protein
MPNVSDLYDLWLKAAHLPADKPVSVTIQKAEVKELHPRPTQTENKLVLSFVGKNRRLILNDGNANRMVGIGGEDWSAWTGLVIQLKRQEYTKDKETIIILPAPTNGNGK